MATNRYKPILYTRIFPTSRCPIEQLPEGWLPFELRTVSDNPDETLIQDSVIIDNEGSMAADRDILQDGISIGLIRSRYEGILFSELSELYSEIRYLN